MTQEILDAGPNPRPAFFSAKRNSPAKFAGARARRAGFDR